MIIRTIASFACSGAVASVSAMIFNQINPPEQIPITLIILITIIGGVVIFGSNFFNTESNDTTK